MNCMPRFIELNGKVALQVAAEDEALQRLSIVIPDYKNVPKNSKFTNFLLNQVTRDIPYPLFTKDIEEVQWDHPYIFDQPDKGIAAGIYLTLPVNHDNFYLDAHFYTRVGSYPHDPSLTAKVAEFFNGRRVVLPVNTALSVQYRDFESYTAVQEENHISLWACAVLKYLSSQESRVGKEIQLLETENSRDGRLDVSVITRERLLLVEAKTSIESALTDNRFRQRIPSYYAESKKIMTALNLPILHQIVLLVGGSEAALFPPGHPDHQADQYTLGRDFIDKCAAAGIKFMTANFLWCCLMQGLVTSSKLHWDTWMWEVLADDTTAGLLSAGRLTADGVVSPLTVPGAAG